MTAHFVRSLTTRLPGLRQAQYHLTPPLSGHAHVVVSAVELVGEGAETVVFASDEHGAIDWNQRLWSRKGSWTDAEMLTVVGYALAEVEP